MASIILITTWISLNVLWWKNIGLKNSDQGYICCTDDTETGSPAQNVVVRGNFSQLVACSNFSCWALLFGRMREEEKRGKKNPAEKRRNGRSSDEHPPLGSWYHRHPPFPAGMPCPRPVTLSVSVDNVSADWGVQGVLCADCSVHSLMGLLGSATHHSWGGRQDREGSVSATAGHSSGEPPPPQHRVCWGEPVGITAWEQPCGASKGTGLRLWDSLGAGAPSWEERQGPEGPTEHPWQ